MEHKAQVCIYYMLLRQLLARWGGRTRLSESGFVWRPADPLDASRHRQLLGIVDEFVVAEVEPPVMVRAGQSGAHAAAPAPSLPPTSVAASAAPLPDGAVGAALGADARLRWLRDATDMHGARFERRVCPSCLLTAAPRRSKRPAPHTTSPLGRAR